MPTYDYKCKKCGHTFEEFQSMRAALLVTCPSCGKPGLVRLMSSGTGLVFKGSGFYQTDYKKSGSSTSSTSSSNSKPESTSKDKSSDSSKDSAKSESKPADPPPSSPSKPDPKK